LNNGILNTLQFSLFCVIICLESYYLWANMDIATDHSNPA